MKRKHWTMIVPGAVLLCTTPAYAVELRDAVQAALSTNPEIRQAVANTAATREERVQAQGLWYPRVSVEGSAGVRSLRNPTRRNIGIADETLWPVEGGLTAPPPPVRHGGRGRGALGVRRPQRRPNLHRLSPPAAAGGDR